MHRCGDGSESDRRAEENPVKETEHFLVYMTGFFLAEQIIMHVCTDGIVITRGEHDIPVDKIRRGVGNLGNTGFLIKIPL